MAERRFLKSCMFASEDTWELEFVRKHLLYIVENIVKHSIIITPHHYGLARDIPELYVFSSVRLRDDAYTVRITTAQWARMFKGYALVHTALNTKKTRGYLWPNAICTQLPALPKAKQVRLVEFDLHYFCDFCGSSLIDWIESSNIEWTPYKRV